MKKVRKVSLYVIFTLVVAVLLGATFVWAINTFTPKTGMSAPVETNQPVAQDTTPKPTPPTVAELLEGVNQQRAKVGVPPLALDPKLDQSAQRKADDMLTYNYFNHVSPHDGEHGYQYINDTGITCETDSENITENTVVNDTQHAIDAWVNSTPHYEAMVNTGYTETGFGIAGNYIVEHFCQP